MKIIAVVVTYNRKKLLVECMESLLNQTFKLDKIVIVDNNSTDNTYQYLVEKNVISNPHVDYFKLSSNIGGSGGFYEGMKRGLKYKPDWVWIMDDDTIPTNTALESLVDAISLTRNDVISFFASTVFGKEREYMNVPNIELKHNKNGYSSWYKYLDSGLVKIKDATFVSLLINVNAIKKVGLPVRDYFIWGDDTEYTLRLTKYYGDAYFVGKSKVIHKRKVAKSISLIDEDNINRLNFHFYMIRNSLFNLRTYYGLRVTIKYILKNCLIMFFCLFKPHVKFRFKKIFIIMRGIIAYLFKRIDYAAFLNRFDVNVKYK